MPTDTKSLLLIQEPLFKKIDEAVKDSEWAVVFELLDTPQPEAWVRQGDSDFYLGQKYEYNEIELLEGILTRISTSYSPCIKSSTIVQDKGRFAVTTHIILQVCFGGKQTFEFDGIATTYAETIKHLTLSTPKSVTDAIKNSCKRIGRLLGRDLNRGIEDLPSIQIEAKESQIDAEFISAKNKVAELGTFEAAIAWMMHSPWKYNPELKKFINETYKKDQ